MPQSGFAGKQVVLPGSEKSVLPDTGDIRSQEQGFQDPEPVLLPHPAWVLLQLLVKYQE